MSMARADYCCCCCCCVCEISRQSLYDASRAITPPT